jgi:hypothetical protein
MPFRPTRVNEELLFDFFLTFSRFEYALKACDFFQRLSTNIIKCYKPSDAKPDWDRFAISLGGAFRADKNEELRQACEYILESPPWRQVVINDVVAWESPVKPKNESDIQFLLRMIRCLRNNLFHGGEYINLDVHEYTERLECLLRSALIILEECLALTPGVKHEFDQARI